jgi:hypothetical protein
VTEPDKLDDLELDLDLSLESLDDPKSELGASPVPAGATAAAAAAAALPTPVGGEAPSPEAPTIGEPASPASVIHASEAPHGSRQPSATSAPQAKKRYSSGRPRPPKNMAEKAGAGGGAPYCHTHMPSSATAGADAAGTSATGAVLAVTA